jgi:ATP-binding cassette subfamily B protein
MQTINETLPDKLSQFVWHYLRDKKWCLFGYTFVAIVFALEVSLSPYWLKVMIDTVIKYSSDTTKIVSMITMPAVFYVLMQMILNLACRLSQYISLSLYPEIKSTIGKDVFSYLLHHSQSFFQNTFAGSLNKKLGDLVERTTELIQIFIEWFYFRFFTLVVAIITLFLAVNPIFAAILFIYAVLFIYLSYVASKGSEQLARKYSEAASIVGGTISDSISNIMSTKLFGNLNEEVARLNDDIDQLVIDDRAMQWYNLKISYIQGTGVTILLGLMLTTLIYGNTHGWVSVGDFALVLALSGSFIQIVYGIGQQIQNFSKIAGMCNQSLSFMRVPHEIINISGALPIHVSKGEIRFQKVSFQYSDNQHLIKDLNLTIAHGQKVGLVGYSGAGKSTFVKLILRLIDPQSGSVFIDDQDIKTITLNSLRKHIITIPQETELFHRTIMENIRFARFDASDEEVVDAAKRARCHEFISGLPEQYNSLVGERGIKLSGGERQRIAIARAFLKNAPILLLDEATSSLDSITENHIKDSLREVMMGKTTIVIAHRLSTLKDMDRILVFVQGKIVEDGALQDLLQNTQSRFYELWQMQSDGFIPVK